jgi:energy-coupling factor transporter ATP-binding protein EcfA2
MAKWCLESIEITGGFLAGLALRLPPRLVCIIGPRGSGKSTLAEAIRAGIAGSSNATKPRQDLIRANLSGALITLTTCSEGGQPQYTVRRAVGQPASVAANDGRQLTSVDLDRGTFLPLDAYSSSEIEAIADESLGDRRRALLDELRPGELQQILLDVAGLRRSLEANADAIRAAERAIHDLTEAIEELGDARARRDALPPLATDEGSAAMLAATRQKQANEREAAQVSGIKTSYNRALEDLRGIATRIQHLRQPFGVPESQNVAKMEATWRHIGAAVEGVETLLQRAVTAMETVGQRIASAEDALRSAHGAQDAELLSLREKSQAVLEAVRERTEAERAVAALEGLEAKRGQERQELERLRAERQQLRARFLLERDRISELREQVAAGLAAEIGRNVRVRVLRNADSLGYREALLQGLKGARVKNHEEILRSLMRLRPEQLAQVIVDNDVTELEHQASLGKERCARILEAFRHSVDPLALEVQPIDDRVSIELNVSSAGDPLFKDAAELSRGQKCTAMLPLLLARRDSPLLIDQPEDNLDNHFIYETVVESLLRLKARRQMIFITHNANIPVLGEADLVVVLDSDGRHGFVQKAGSFEECRDEIIDLLEGGREAFELRSRRYGKR